MIMANPKGVLTPGRMGKQKGNASTIMIKFTPVSPAISSRSFRLRGDPLSPWVTKVFSVFDSGGRIYWRAARRTIFLNQNLPNRFLGREVYG